MNSEPGPRINVSTPENFERVRQAILRSPSRLARHNATKLGMNKKMVSHILQKNVWLHPYKISIIQELNVETMHKELPLQKACLQFTMIKKI